MSQDVFTLFGEMTTENLMETITKSMDDFLYVFDIQNNKIEISQSAVDRFMIYNEYGRWDGSESHRWNSFHCWKKQDLSFRLEDLS